MATTRVMLSEEEIVKIIDYYVNNKTSFKKVASLFNTKEYLIKEGIITFNKESNSLCLEKLFEMVKKFNQ